MTLRAMAALAALLFIPLLPAQAAEPVVDGPAVTWRVGAWGKPRAGTAHAEAFRKYVDERTGGKFKVQIGYESYGGPKELLDIMKVGGIEMTMICSSYHPDKTPAYTALDLPFLPIADADAQERVHEAFHKHPVIEKEFAGWNGKLFLSAVLPQYEFIGRGKAPKTLDDFKGMRVRAIGGIGDAMLRLGAVPTSMDPTEVYMAMERGTVDAVSGPSTYWHQSFKTYELGKWFSENMSLGTQACPMVINLDHWAKLPEQYKALFEPSKAVAYAAVKAAYRDADEKNLVLFKKKGLTFVRFGDEELAAFRAKGGEPVWADWVAKRESQGIPGRDLLNLILTTARGVGSKS